MKQLLVIFLILTCTKLFAQDTIRLKHIPDTVHLRHTPNELTITDRPPQAVFAEIFGRSLDFSLNYDRRFLNQVDGWGFCAGIGVVENEGNNDNNNYFSIPVSVNYLAGRNGKYLEVGAGLTYFNAIIDNTGGASSSGNSVIGTFIIGYRNQPIRGGFMFRAGFSPVILKNSFIPYYPYVSFGYNF
jgi:hypothetical protein